MRGVAAAVAAVPAAAVITIGVVVLVGGLVVVTAITGPARGSTAGEITPVPTPTPTPYMPPTMPTLAPIPPRPRGVATPDSDNNDPCRTLRVACFSLGARPEYYADAVSYHIGMAQLKGLPSTLTYAGGGATARARRDIACSSDRMTLIGLPFLDYQCDEYPFATTYEGGANTSIAAVPESDNGAQGVILNRFYRTNFKFRGGPDAKFLVIVVP